MGARQGQRGFCNVPLGHLCAIRDLLDNLAVSVPRIEIHGRIDAGRITLQDRFDTAHLLEEVLPGRVRHR